MLQYPIVEAFPRSPIPRPGRRLALRLTLSGLLVVVLSGGAVAATAEIGVSKIPKPDDFAKPVAPEIDPSANPGSPQTLLLTGLDHRYADGEGTPSRSDTMMLVRLDPEANATTMLSLPRDLEVPIAGYGPTPQKLNAAWALGNGPKVLTKTIRTSLLGTPQDPFRINGVVSIRFDAFSKAVNELGCIYTDVDRKYFVAPGAGYAQIDQPAGYQLLCGQDALAYVRFRHADSDITREARQANFLADMRTQVDATDALTGGLLGAIEPFVQTTIQGNRQYLRIAKLLVGIAGKPTKRVKLATTFTADGGVATTPEALARARRQFMNPPKQKKAKGPASGSSSAKAGSSAKSSGSTKRRKAKTPTALPPTMLSDKPGAQQIASVVGSQTSGLPIWAPSARLSAGVYQSEASRGYEILDKKRRPKWPAYRIVVQTPDAGEYYGVEGTTWKDPPILKLASGTVRLAGRTWRVQYDGGRIRRLFWQSPSATYWISNTLGDDLSSREMYALARTFGRRSASSGAAAGTTSGATATTPDPAVGTTSTP